MHCLLLLGYAGLGLGLGLGQGGEHVVDILVIRIVTGLEDRAGQRACSAEKRGGGAFLGADFDRSSGQHHHCETKHECAGESQPAASTDRRLRAAPIALRPLDIYRLRHICLLGIILLTKI